jgi:hypothetical protein
MGLSTMVKHCPELADHRDLFVYWQTDAKQRKRTWSAERSAKLVKALSDSRKARPPKSLTAMAGMSASIAPQSHKLRIFY